MCNLVIIFYSTTFSILFLINDDLDIQARAKEELEEKLTVMETKLKMEQSNNKLLRDRINDLRKEMATKESTIEMQKEKMLSFEKLEFLHKSEEQLEIFQKQQEKWEDIEKKVLIN
jgi:hypothetical protein